MTALATLLDLAAYTGQTADPTDLKAVRALDAASGLVRAYCAREFTYTEDEEITLDGTGTFSLVLPEAPIIDVTLVEEVDNDDVATEVEATDYRFVAEAGLLYRLDEPWCEGIQNVHVTYSHGYTLPGIANPTLPPEVRAVTAQIAARLYQQATDEGRVITQRSLGSYSETFGDAQGSTLTLGLEPQETQVLARYRMGGLV